MTFKVQDIKCAAMPTSPAYKNCTFNETSFTEVFDKPESVTRLDGICGQLSSDGKKAKDSRALTIGLT